MTNEELFNLIKDVGIKTVDNDRALLELGEALTTRVMELTEKVNELNRLYHILHREMNRVMDYEDKETN